MMMIRKSIIDPTCKYGSKHGTLLHLKMAIISHTKWQHFSKPPMPKWRPCRWTPLKYPMDDWTIEENPSMMHRMPVTAALPKRVHSNGTIFSNTLVSKKTRQRGFDHQKSPTLLFIESPGKGGPSPPSKMNDRPCANYFHLSGLEDCTLCWKGA